MHDDVKYFFLRRLKVTKNDTFYSRNCVFILDVSDLLTDPFFFFQETLHVELHKCDDLCDCQNNKGAEEHVVDGQSQPA